MAETMEDALSLYGIKTFLGLDAGTYTESLLRLLAGHLATSATGLYRPYKYNTLVIGPCSALIDKLMEPVTLDWETLAGPFQIATRPQKYSEGRCDIGMRVAVYGIKDENLSFNAWYKDEYDRQD
jgi:hypothetical protein